MIFRISQLVGDGRSAVAGETGERGKRGVARLYACGCARVWMQGRERDRVRYVMY